MQITLTGNHLDITDALRSYVEEKMEKIRRHYEQIIDARVTLEPQNNSHRAEATLNLSGKTIFADAVEADMYAAIDAMTDKLDRQIIKHKEKQKDHHSTPTKHLEI